MSEQSNLKPVSQEQPASDDAAKASTHKMIVAVHGIGDQFNHATVQTVAYRFCDFFNKPKGLPLGSFHAKRVGQQQTALFTSPSYPERLRSIRFAEVYWAEIPRKPASEGHTIEESKKWAKTIIERLRLQCANQGSTSAGNLSNKDYEKIEFVLEEMIDTLLVLERLCQVADKAGIFQFDLRQILRDYLGDVQIVTEFADYRQKILKQFFDVMKTIQEDCDEIYIIAHSEGTVISFLGLLQALCNYGRQGEEQWQWIKKVRGYMTIGSPIDKHLILWPELWKEFELKPSQQSPSKPVTSAGRQECAKPRPLPDMGKIQWRNYYDYGDPIGFELNSARDFLCDNGLQDAFEFDEKKHDLGFYRSLFPGKAHNDYWQDIELFNHFITTVVKEKADNTPKKAGAFPKRKNLPGRRLFTFWIPYLIAAILLTMGVYVIYKAAAEAAPSAPEDTLTILRNVLGLSALLAGITLMARLPRLAPRKTGLEWGVLAFVILAGIYYLLIPARGVVPWFAELPKAIVDVFFNWLNITRPAYFDPLLVVAIIVMI